MSTKWGDLKHKSSPERREKLKQEALARYAETRGGMARLRLARNKTQLGLAGEMNVPQSVISRMERGNNPQLKTVQRFIEGLGGRLEMSAVFPDDRIDLAQLLEGGRPEKHASLAGAPPPRRRRGASTAKKAGLAGNKEATQ